MARKRSPFYVEIAANLKSLRIKKYGNRGGAKKCAEAMGVSPQQWSQWETGYRTPDAWRMQQMADFFGVTLEDLVKSGVDAQEVNSSTDTIKNLVGWIREYIDTERKTRSDGTIVSENGYTTIGGLLDSVLHIYGAINGNQHTTRKSKDLAQKWVEGVRAKLAEGQS